MIQEVCLDLARQLLAKKWQLATAESCTGGLISGHCTNLPGSSAWFERGFVTYSNASKTELLGVDPSLISARGAVSEAVAKAMALGAVLKSSAQVSLAVTGIAGPDGGSSLKPVGTVWLAWCVNGVVTGELHVFQGDRFFVRESACLFALEGLLKRL